MEIGFIYWRIFICVFSFCGSVNWGIDKFDDMCYDERLGQRVWESTSRLASLII
jgi:hypothetical protein